MQQPPSSPTTPWEYAYSLQQRHLDTQAASIAADVCDILTANLLGALPPTQRRVLEDIPVIVLPTGQVNAAAMQVPGGGYVISLDYGMFSLLTTLNRIVLCRLNL